MAPPVKTLVILLCYTLLITECFCRATGPDISSAEDKDDDQPRQKRGYSPVLAVGLIPLGNDLSERVPRVARDSGSGPCGSGCKSGCSECSEPITMGCIEETTTECSECTEATTTACSGDSETESEGCSGCSEAAAEGGSDCCEAAAEGGSDCCEGEAESGSECSEGAAEGGSDCSETAAEGCSGCTDAPAAEASCTKAPAAEASCTKAPAAEANCTKAPAADAERSAGVQSVSRTGGEEEPLFPKNLQQKGVWMTGSGGIPVEWLKVGGTEGPVLVVAHTTQNALQQLLNPTTESPALILAALRRGLSSTPPPIDLAAMLGLQTTTPMPNLGSLLGLFTPTPTPAINLGSLLGMFTPTPTPPPLPPWLATATPTPPPFPWMTATPAPPQFFPWFTPTPTPPSGPGWGSFFSPPPPTLPPATTEGAMLPVVMAAIPLPEKIIEPTQSPEISGNLPGQNAMHHMLQADRLLREIHGEVDRKVSMGKLMRPFEQPAAQPELNLRSAGLDAKDYDDEHDEDDEHGHHSDFEED